MKACSLEASHCTHSHYLGDRAVPGDESGVTVKRLRSQNVATPVTEWYGLSMTMMID